MFDPERLLGGMIRQGLGKRGKKHRNSGFGGLATSAVGLGIMGVAMAAFDHYMEQRNQPGAAPGGYAPAGGTTPVPPPMGAPSTPPPPPPPPPPGGTTPAADAQRKAAQEQAILLIRAMIAAANADGVIDAHERAQIINGLKEGGLPEEDRGFILNEFLNPPGMDSIVSQADSPELAKSVYAASLFAIELDTEAERQYMDELARRLSLSAEDRAAIEGETGTPEKDQTSPEGE
ncbi:MAG: DUF533 domain-containing protein [bacterium]|nr:DUF533 domain-containing protein [bacterium]